MHSIPRKYCGTGILHEMLLIAIRDNWPRIRYEYEEVLDWLKRTGRNRDVDKALLVQFRKDIRRDGANFIETQDGIGGRLKDWLIEAFPGAF